jgi:uncharacterized repeat protein (TIGR01451 family)
MLFSCVLKSQVLEQYTTDTLNDNGKIGQCIKHKGYIYYSSTASDQSGSFDIGLHHQPVVRKLDSLGNIIWSTSQYDREKSYYKIRKMILINDETIICYLNEDINDNYFIWKIDVFTGNIIYKHKLGLYISDIKPYNKDTILATQYLVSEQKSNIFLFDTKKRNEILLDKVIVPSGMISIKDTILYISNDTLIKRLITDDNMMPIFKTKLPKSDLNELIYIKEFNLIMFFRKFNLVNFVTCIDNKNGIILWDKQISGLYRDYIIDEDEIYFAMNPEGFGGGEHPSIIHKIDIQTGKTIWLKNTVFLDTINKQEEIFDIEMKGEYIFATGAYENYLPRYGKSDYKWGISKFKKSDGTRIFFSSVISTEINPFLGKKAEGLIVVPIKDNALCLGNIYEKYLNSETKIELDSTGKILYQKSLGGYAKNNSRIISINQLNNGKIVVLQYIGIHCELSLRDINGTIEWSTIIGSSSYLLENDKFVLKIHNDSTVWIAATLNYNLHIMKFDPNNYKLKKISSFHESWNSIINDLVVLDDQRVVVTVITGSFEITCFGFQTNETYTNAQVVSKSFSTIGLNPIYLDRVIQSQLITNYSNDTMVMISGSALYVIPYQGVLGLHKSYAFTDVKTLSSINILHDSSFIVLGNHRITNNLLVLRIKKSNLKNPDIYNTNIIGNGVKWIVGETKNLIYILSDDNRKVNLTKFDVLKGEVIWTKLISEGNLTFPSIFAIDIVYNKTLNYILCTGFRQNIEKTNKQIFIAMATSDGDVIFDELRNGWFPGENMGLTLCSDKISGSCLVGGSITRDTTLSSSFIYYLNDDNLFKPIIGKVFLDVNENKVQDISEPNISVGKVILDNKRDLFLNKNGIFYGLTSYTQHTLKLKVPFYFSHTTDSIVYTVNNPSNLDTIYFGIKPNTVKDSIESFIFADPFVCNEESNLVLFIKNNGSNINNLLSKLECPVESGKFNLVPDSTILSTFNSVFWNFSDFLPGQYKEIRFQSKIPGVSSIGDLISFKTSNYLFYNNTFYDSTSYVYDDIVLCAYDPNDKHVNPSGIGQNNLTLFNQYLNYTIRFQNTGNYMARNITIVDTLSEHLDLSTFEFIASSHPLTNIRNKGNDFSFEFKNIFLPDSLSNERESHGFISFRIKPKANLDENTRILNKANIYFDYNPAIVTNSALNTLVSKINVSGTKDKNLGHSFILSPNPTSDFLAILHSYANLSSFKYSILNIHGQVQLDGYYENGIDISSLSSGVYLVNLQIDCTLKPVMLKFIKL